MREIVSPSLKERTTLRLGGRALAEICLESPQDLDKLPVKLTAYGGKPFCIGRGSNILAMDGILPITLVRIMFDDEPQVIGEENGRTLVRVSAGVSMPKLLKFCIKNGLSGLEGLVGIPGTVGGAVAMNAGSFGAETAAFLHEVCYFADNQIKYCKSRNISAGYRSLKLVGEPEMPIVLGCIFALTKRPKNVISTDMSHNFFIKKSRQPLNYWSAGSAFKNPGIGVFAGQLLERAGFRGKRLGGMAFSQKHANFLINEGHGDAGAALELLNLAREEVKKLYGIELEPEIRIIPWH